MIAEAANGPTMPLADWMLYDRSVLVLPDIYANAGGVAVSYFEWVQGIQAFAWSTAGVDSKLKRIMADSFAAIHDASCRYHVHLSTAALARAIQRVAEVTRVRGIYP